MSTNLNTYLPFLYRVWNFLQQDCLSATQFLLHCVYFFHLGGISEATSSHVFKFVCLSGFPPSNCNNVQSSSGRKTRHPYLNSYLEVEGCKECLWSHLYVYMDLKANIRLLFECRGWHGTKKKTSELKWHKGVKARKQNYSYQDFAQSDSRSLTKQHSYSIALKTLHH